jgi:hypothetical protein
MLTAKIDPEAFDVNVHPGDEGPAAGGLNIEVKYNQFASSDLDKMENSLVLTFQKKGETQ